MELRVNYIKSTDGRDVLTDEAIWIHLAKDMAVLLESNVDIDPALYGFVFEKVKETNEDLGLIEYTLIADVVKKDFQVYVHEQSQIVYHYKWYKRIGRAIKYIFTGSSR